MPNPYVNKVVYGTTVIVDLTDTTASASDVVNSKIFYTAAGKRETGSLTINKYYTGSSNPSTSLGNNGDLYLKV